MIILEGMFESPDVLTAEMMARLQGMRADTGGGGDQSTFGCSITNMHSVWYMSSYPFNLFPLAHLCRCCHVTTRYLSAQIRAGHNI